MHFPIDSQPIARPKSGMIPLACQSSPTTKSHQVSLTGRTGDSRMIQIMDLVGIWLGHAQFMSFIMRTPAEESPLELMGYFPNGDEK